MGIRYIGIDPSTKTGLVILDSNGIVLVEKEIKSKIKADPQRFLDLSGQVCYQIHENCFDHDIKVAIEGFSFGSKGRGVSTQFGIGWAIRSELVSSSIPYTEVSPGGLKKFASGKGNTKKDNLVIPIYKKWGYESDSDNIRDAYVLAQIARAMHEEPSTSYQREVIRNLEITIEEVKK